MSDLIADPHDPRRKKHAVQLQEIQVQLNALKFQYRDNTLAFRALDLAWEAVRLAWYAVQADVVEHLDEVESSWEWLKASATKR
jgi:L-ascorbate metabolism protein UlaG (beta-lactamase superfamily)